MVFMAVACCCLVCCCMFAECVRCLCLVDCLRGVVVCCSELLFVVVDFSVRWLLLCAGLC